MHGLPVVKAHIITNLFLKIFLIFIALVSFAMAQKTLTS